jgi:hypothetical protein
MASQGRGSMTAAASLLAGFLVTACIGRPQSPRADPAKGFDPNAAAETKHRQPRGNGARYPRQDHPSP